MRPVSRKTAASSCTQNPWAAIAEAMLGNGDRAVQIIDRILPLKKDARVYKNASRTCSCRIWPATSIRNSASRAIPWLSGHGLLGQPGPDQEYPGHPPRSGRIDSGSGAACGLAGLFPRCAYSAG